MGIIPKVQGSRFKVKKAGPLRLAPCTLHLNKGFTLLELIVVLFIVVLGFSVVGINLSSGNDATELKVAARDIVSALRFARGQALISHQETTVTLDLAENTYTVSGRDKIYSIPKAIDVTVVTAQSELTGRLWGAFVFLPTALLQAVELLWNWVRLPGKSI